MTGELKRFQDLQDSILKLRETMNAMKKNLNKEYFNDKAYLKEQEYETGEEDC